MTTTLDTAGRDILEMLRLLECKMRAKGWEKARADFSMLGTGYMDVQISVADARGSAFRSPLGDYRGWCICHGGTIIEAFAAADRAIAEMLDHPTEAMAPWFEPGHQEAAE